MQIDTATVIAGYATTGLTTSTTPTVVVNQGTAQNLTPTTTFSFTENFDGAFKTRVLAQDNTPYAGQGTPGSNGSAPQNVTWQPL